MHEPVMVDEVVHHFKDKKNGIILDGTMGCGGHSLELLNMWEGHGKIIGLDQDAEAIDRSAHVLEKYSENVTFKNVNFVLLDTVLDELGITKIDGCLFDIGVSKNQLVTPERGFSFRLDGPLDMRMDQSSERTAADIVNTASAEELSDIIYHFGEERNSRRIARAIVRARDEKEITSTKELAEVIKRASPKRHYYKIHPATRTFQALRISVNNELENLKVALEKVLPYLSDDAVICVISFHSLEDRIVKRLFRAWAAEGLIRIVTKRPLQATEEEIERNPHARSAKMRVAKRSLQL